MEQDYRSPPRYTPHPAKAVEVILWLANHQPGIDVYHLVKAAYFADKMHVRSYGRPIVGDEYKAAAFGPLPQVIYGLLCFQPIEVLAASANGRLPFQVTDTFEVRPNREANARHLSQSDEEALDYGLAFVRDKSFDDLCVLTHEDPAYLKAEGGLIDYRDFLDEDDPDRDEKAEDLSEIARYAVF